MLSPENKITISAKHQSYLKILDANINDGETVTWAVIRKAYRKRALIVHPDKGGSEDAFKELNTAFQKLERLIEYGAEFEFDSLAEMSSSWDEMFNEFMAHFDRINEESKRDLDEINSTLHTGFSEINASLGEIHSIVSELHASTQKLKVALDNLSDSVDQMATNTKRLHASIRAIDDNFNIDLSFYLGCYAVFLGSVVYAISGKHRLQNARYVGAFVFGTGLIATTGYLIANSVFKKDKPIPSNENNEQVDQGPGLTVARYIFAKGQKASH